MTYNVFSGMLNPTQSVLTLSTQAGMANCSVQWFTPQSTTKTTPTVAAASVYRKMLHVANGVLGNLICGLTLAQTKNSIYYMNTCQNFPRTFEILAKPAITMEN